MGFGFHHSENSPPMPARNVQPVGTKKEASIAMPRIRPDEFLLLPDSSCLDCVRPLRALLETAPP
jgi:hypothetical protein